MTTDDFQLGPRVPFLPAVKEYPELPQPPSHHRTVPFLQLGLTVKKHDRPSEVGFEAAVGDAGASLGDELGARTKQRSSSLEHIRLIKRRMCMQ